MSELINMTGSETYTVIEAAHLLGISHESLYRLIRQNECPVRYLKLGRSVRIPKRALEEYINGPTT